jgi:transcriptional regulator with XRE-family HTH domain
MAETFMIDKQIKAARAFLGWRREDLAEQSGLALSSIQTIEEGGNTTQKTIDKVLRALQKNGIVLTDDGVRMPDTSVIKLEGKTWFVDLLDDAYNTLKTAKNKELLIFGGDNRVSPPPVVEAFRRLRQAGVRIREMVQEGNTFLMGPESDYRWIPNEFFKNYVTVIYGNKVCNDFSNTGVLFLNANWAQAERNKFELMWSQLPELTIKSTADVRY